MFDSWSTKMMKPLTDHPLMHHRFGVVKRKGISLISKKNLVTRSLDLMKSNPWVNGKNEKEKTDDEEEEAFPDIDMDEEEENNDGDVENDIRERIFIDLEDADEASNYQGDNQPNSSCWWAAPEIVDINTVFEPDSSCWWIAAPEGISDLEPEEEDESSSTVAAAAASLYQHEPTSVRQLHLCENK